MYYNDKRGNTFVKEMIAAGFNVYHLRFGTFEGPAVFVKSRPIFKVSEEIAVFNDEPIREVVSKTTISTARRETHFGTMITTAEPSLFPLLDGKVPFFFNEAIPFMSRELTIQFLMLEDLKHKSVTMFFYGKDQEKRFVEFQIDFENNDAIFSNSRGMSLTVPKINENREDYWKSFEWFRDNRIDSISRLQEKALDFLQSLYDYNNKNAAKLEENRLTIKIKGIPITIDWKGSCKNNEPVFSAQVNSLDKNDITELLDTVESWYSEPTPLG